MTCSNCGAELEPGAPICPSCGASTSVAAPDDAIVIRSPEDALARGDVELASIARRAGARVIDAVVLGVIVFVVFVAVGGDGNPAESLLGFLVSLVIGFVYEVSFVTSRGQTPGKMACSIKIVDEEGRTLPPVVGRAATRYIVPTVAGIIPFAGIILSVFVYFSAAWDPLRQGWHDKAAHTMVISASS